MRLRHRVRAATGPDLSLARDLADVARREMSAGSWRAGAEHMAAAAELAMGTAEGEQLAAEAIDCRLMTGDALDRAGEAARLRTFGATAWRAYVLARLALVDGRLSEAEPLLTDAWRCCDAESDPSLAARIAGQLAWLYVARDRGQDAVVWSEQALDLAGAHEPTDLTRLIHLMSLGMTGRVEERLAVLADLPDPAAASVEELDALLGRARLRKWSDDLHGAYQDLTGLLGPAADRSITFQVIVNFALGHVEYLLGRWDDAVLHSGLAVSLAVDAEQGWLASICHAVASLVHSARGQWDQATDHIEQGARLVVYPDHVVAAIYVASARARLAMARNDQAAVIDALRPLVAHGPGSVAFEPGVILHWEDVLAEALALAGQHEEAQAVLAPYEARATRYHRRSAMAAAARPRARSWRHVTSSTMPWWPSSEGWSTPTGSTCPSSVLGSTSRPVRASDGPDGATSPLLT